jgi:hypothetical protein
MRLWGAHGSVMPQGERDVFCSAVKERGRLRSEYLQLDAVSMHGSSRNPDRKPESSKFATLWVRVAFAAIPLLLTVVITVLRFGRETTFDPILEVWVAAAAHLSGGE